MKNSAITLAFALSGIFALSAQEKIPVFISGTEGYEVFRIPAIIRLPEGDLLAFCEGRVGGSSDFGDIDIAMKRSRDGGKTWSSLKRVADNGSSQAGNPAPVIDQSDPRFPKGRIFLFYNTGTVTEREIREGKGYKQVWFITSEDGGETWSPATDITTQVHRQNKPDINPEWNFGEDWRYYANTPGHAMQFAEGPYKGRIYVAANHSYGPPSARAEDYRAHGFYSDNHGQSFHLSAPVDVGGSNESMAAELAGGRLMMNIRNQKGEPRQRMVALSSDGGVTWDTVYFDPQLPDPVCQGSILTIGRKSGKNILAFCNAADTSRRDNLTLRISYDDGKTWKKNILVDSSGERKERNYTAYSDLAKTGKRRIGILYERNGYREIIFQEFKW